MTLGNVGKSIWEFWKKAGIEAKKTAKEAEDKAEGIAKDISREPKQVYSDVSKAGTEAKKTAREAEDMVEGIAEDIYRGAKQVYSDVSKRIKASKNKS
jgi:gas vesicle protein